MQLPQWLCFLISCVGGANTTGVLGSLWWDPFGALWLKIQDAELIFTALNRDATSLYMSRWRLSNQRSPQPAPAALLGPTWLWSTWEATGQAETLGFKPHLPHPFIFLLCLCVCHRLMPMMTMESCWGAGQGITSVEHPLWIGLGVSQFCSSTTKQRSQSNMASAGSSQESSTQVSSDLPPVSETLIIVLVSQATVPLSSRGGRVCL